MTTYDEILAGRPVLSNAAEPLSLRLIRRMAAFLVGIAAFFINLEPVWSINAPSPDLVRPHSRRRR